MPDPPILEKCLKKKPLVINVKLCETRRNRKGIERERERVHHMYSAMTFSVKSHRLRLMRSLRRDIVVWLLRIPKKNLKNGKGFGC